MFWVERKKWINQSLSLNRVCSHWPNSTFFSFFGCSFGEQGLLSFIAVTLVRGLLVCLWESHEPQAGLELTKDLSLSSSSFNSHSQGEIISAGSRRDSEWLHGILASRAQEWGEFAVRTWKNSSVFSTDGRLKVDRLRRASTHYTASRNFLTYVSSVLGRTKEEDVIFLYIFIDFILYSVLVRFYCQVDTT